MEFEKIDFSNANKANFDSRVFTSQENNLSSDQYLSQLLSNVTTRETFLQPREIFGQIIFDSVKFAYGPVDREPSSENYVLNEVSFSVEPGEVNIHVSHRTIFVTLRQALQNIRNNLKLHEETLI